jgi:hypothetical protein
MSLEQPECHLREQRYGRVIEPEIVRKTQKSGVDFTDVKLPDLTRSWWM